MEAIKSSPRQLTHAIPVYEVRLVQSRRPLRLAEECIADAPSAARALHALIGLTDREHLACLFVNGHNRITGAHIAAVGGQHLIGAVDVRVILRAALAACASSLVLGHNHPSGDPAPSDQDLTTTAHIMRAAKVLTIPMLDHVIVTRDPSRYHSMLDRGTLPRT
jgi:DNA repair protein RadC